MDIILIAQGLILIILVTVLFLERLILKKLLFIRKTHIEHIKEQNDLLNRILDNQTSPPISVPAAPVVQVSPPQEAVSSDYVEDVIHFIPKAVKATKTDVSNLDTKASKFEASDVEKLKKAKEALKK